MSVWVVALVVIGCLAVAAGTGLFLAVAFREMLRPVLARHGRASGVYVVIALSLLGVVPIALGVGDVSDGVALPVVAATTIFAIASSMVVMYRRPKR